MVIMVHNWLMVFLSAFLLGGKLNNTAELQSPKASNAFHPFFVSVTEVNHNAKEKELEISCRIFTDDFEKTLTKANKVKVDILNPADKKKLDQQINDYISKHFILKIDGKPVTMQYIGHEREEEAIWNYFEVKNITGFKTIEIIDNLLFETHEEQTNLVHVIQNGNRQSRELRNPNGLVKFEF